MGIYSTTILYHGRMLSPCGFQRLKNLPDKAYITRVCQDRWILHAPGKCLTLASMDPMIEDSEKEVGFVCQTEVDKLLFRHQKLKAEWDSATTAQLDELSSLVRAAGGDETAEPSNYMCELQWSTLDGNTDNTTLQYNLQVK